MVVGSFVFYEVLIKEKVVVAFSYENELGKLVENFLYIFKMHFCQN